jgi:hypothetical protein
MVDEPWYMLNTVIGRDLQIATVKEEIYCYSSQYSARLSAHPNDLVVNPMELSDNRRLRRHLPNDLLTRFLKTPAKWSAYQIPSVIIVFVVLVCKSHSQKQPEALNLLVTGERYWALFYMSLHTFLQNLLNALVQIANKMGLQKELNTTVGHTYHKRHRWMRSTDIQWKYWL